MNEGGPVDEAHFRAIPWCQTILDDPSHKWLKRHSRKTPAGSTSHTLFAHTLNTPSTILATYSIYKIPSPSTPITETATFMALGSGMNGHVDMAHGGTVAMMLDSVSGLMQGVGMQPGGDPRLPVFTKYLHITYLRPVSTPQVVCVRARVVRVEGRKGWVEASICNGRDQVLARAEALWVRVKERRDQAKSTL